MKLAAKITFCLLALLGVVFAIGGFFMVESNFNRGLEDAAQRGLASHLNAKEALRANLANAMYDGTAPQEYTLSGWGGQMAASLEAEGGTLALLNEGYTAYYNNLPREFGKGVQAAILAQPRYTQLFYRLSGSTYIVFPDRVSMNGKDYWLISAFNVSPVFAERQIQSNTFYVIYAIVLLASALLAVVASMLITRPLRRLEKAAQSIAAGAYGERTGLAGNDEIGRLAAAFDEMAEAVESRVDSLTLAAKQREDFMGAFTHELKTPMTAMMGYAALLKKDKLHGEEKDKALGYIHSETKRLEELSQKLLMLMGLSEENICLAPVKLDDVLGKVDEAFPPSGSRPTMPEKSEICVLADEDLLAALIINLVNNGFNAQAGGGTVNIGINENKADGTATLFVQDFGKGIAPQELARITEPFYQIERSRHKGTSGLGLALCRRIAQLHGGELEFDSIPEKGTTVRFVLQLAAEAVNGREGEQ